MFDRRTRHSHEVYAQLRKYFARQVCDPIHHNVRLSEAPACGHTIFEYDGSAQGARDYQILVERIVNHGDRQKTNT
jgi:chromosome partitioning protein